MKPHQDLTYLVDRAIALLEEGPDVGSRQWNEGFGCLYQAQHEIRSPSTGSKPGARGQDQDVGRGAGKGAGKVRDIAPKGSNLAPWG